METFSTAWNMGPRPPFPIELNRFLLGKAPSSHRKLEGHRNPHTGGKAPPQAAQRGHRRWRRCVMDLEFGTLHCRLPLSICFPTDWILLTSMFTFSPVVVPKCESSWEQGFVLRPRLELSHPPSSPEAPTALPDPSPSQHPAPWGHWPAAPPPSLHCSRPPLPPLVVVLRFVLKGLRCGGGLGFLPFPSAADLGADPDFLGSHFCAAVRAPAGGTSSDPQTVSGMRAFSWRCCKVHLCCVQPGPFSVALLFVSDDGGFKWAGQFENHLHSIFRVQRHHLSEFSDVLVVRN